MHETPPPPEELDRQRGVHATLIGARHKGERVTVDFDVIYSGPLRLSLERGDWARLLAALHVVTPPGNTAGNAPKAQCQKPKRRGLFPALRSILFGDPQTPKDSCRNNRSDKPSTRDRLRTDPAYRNAYLDIYCKEIGIKRENLTDELRHWMLTGELISQAARPDNNQNHQPSAPDRQLDSAPKPKCRKPKHRGLIPALRSILFGDLATPAGATAARQGAAKPDSSNQAYVLPFNISPSDLGPTERYRIPAEALADLQVAIAPEQAHVLAQAEYQAEEIENGLRQAGLLKPHTERAATPSSPQLASATIPSWEKA